MVLNSVELNLVDRFLSACMPWFTSSSVEHDENFLVEQEQFFNHKTTIKDMKYLSTQMNYTGLITTQTKFQLDLKK